MLAVDCLACSGMQRGPTGQEFGVCGLVFVACAIVPCGCRPSSIVRSLTSL